uniref:Uncharacterized protein n=1 Tax=Anopheles epiroticus TaxID=199890 RepID=A0A182PQ70_9DIPT
MASGRARLPPTPGTVASVSAASCTRPTLTELHTNNNLYHSSTTVTATIGEGAGVTSAVASAGADYQHPMHHQQLPSHHHHHQLPHHQQEVGATTSQMHPDVGLLGHGVTQSLRKPFDVPRHM